MAHSPRSSTASECSYDEDPKEPCKVNLSTPVVVAWGAEHTRLDIHMQYDSQSRTAFFKLRDSLVLKALSPVKTYLYLFLAPERIRSLTLDESPDFDSIPPDTAQLLGSTFTSLRFVLSEPGDFVGPKFARLTPKNKIEGQVLDHLRSLARVTEFSIFVPHQAASKCQLLSVCQGISDGVKSPPGQTDLACLYEGKGGIRIAPDPLNPATARPDKPEPPSGENPPSYTEAGGGGPPAAAVGDLGPASKKRRLEDPEPSQGVGVDLLAMIEATCRKIVREEVRTEIQGLEKRLTDKMESLAEKYAEKQGECLEDELQGNLQAMDEKIDDEFYGLRIKLEDFIKEEIVEAEERVVEHLQSTASVHLEFG